jgi:hypothetical protein
MNTNHNKTSKGAYMLENMSQNAVNAYNNGLLPLNQIKTKNDKFIAKKYYKFILNKIVTEWHHVGENYTKVFFSSSKEIVENLEFYDDILDYKNKEEFELSRKILALFV